jgi:hypothetical protein
MQLIICLSCPIQHAGAHHVCVQAARPVAAQDQLLCMEGVDCSCCRTPMQHNKQQCRVTLQSPAWVDNTQRRD